ncbi:MAG: CHAT domain-containing protein [Planctomycetaceae bacterium]|nr:CHAT domain-containing protein [Planctomycetaceae bacterium]
MLRRTIVVVLAALLVLCTRPGAAQMERRTPSTTYYQCFGLFYQGDYIDALRGFESESRSSIKTVQSRWIDSICYETMCGECYFHMGRLDEALRRYTNALEIYRQFPDWMMKVQFSSPTIRPAAAGARKVVPWGQSTRQSTIGSYPGSEKMLQGQVDMNEVVQRGGVLTPASFFPVTPHEIVRCTALALRRRATLLGPVCKHDQLSNDVIAALTRPAAPANHWSECYVDAEHGLALVAGGREGQAIGFLQRSVLAGGQFDHPLTCVALLSLGHQSLAIGKYDDASKFFMEATYAAVNTYSSTYVPDYGVLEEAFRYAALTHLMANRKGVFPALEPAILWAKRNQLRHLQASLLLSAAENYAVLGNTRLAGAMLDDARSVIGRRTMATGAIGARLSYVTATLAYQQKRVSEGNAAFAAAMGYMQRGSSTPVFRGKSGGSFRLFHIGLADGLYASGGITPRGAMDLFGEVLRDPRPSDWALDPMESLAVLMTPHHGALEHWFEAAVERSGVKDVAIAVEIAERARRHRFFTSLELGGRLESLRWILEAAPDRLSREALLQRQDLLARYPAYNKLWQQSQEMRTALAKTPPKADDRAAAQEQSRQLAALGAVSAKQEAILREMSLRREPAAMVFPPLLPLATIQKSLPDKHAVMCFFATGHRLYGFLLNNERCSCWQVAAPQTLSKQIQTLLRDMGQFGANHEIAVKDLANGKWKQSGRQVLDTLLKGSPADFSQSFDELVIVPDGVLWYLPFEALQVKADGKMRPLISRFCIRYAPTLSLCASQGAGHSRSGSTAVVMAKVRAGEKGEKEDAAAAFEQFLAAVPGAIALKPPTPAPTSLYAMLFQRLVVLEDVTPLEDPYGWTPMPLDRTKAGGTVADWLVLPWGKPDAVVLSGFHTAAEDAFKRVRHGPPGNEMFLSACGLMGSGTRTLLLSRWRTGGQSSLDLVREFVQELSDTSPADAWQRAVLLGMDARINLEAEPRIKRGTTEESPKAGHPFFWAGYMLVDCTPPPKAEQPAAKAKRQ